MAAFLRVVNSSANLAQVRKRAVYIQKCAPRAIRYRERRHRRHADALVNLSAKSPNPSVQTQIGAIQSLLKTAMATADGKRPSIMGKVVKQIDAASAALFTAPPPTP